MSEGNRNPELFDGDDDLRQDPCYIAYAADLEGQADCADGVRLKDGMGKLRERGCTQAELDAYVRGYSQEAMFKMARACNIPVPPLQFTRKSH